MSVMGLAALTVGAAFMLIGAIGTLRLPDLYTRIHAVTKAGTVGVGFMMLALTLFRPEVAVFTQAMGVILFVALTAPVAAHMISRAARLTEVSVHDETFVDETRSTAPDQESVSRSPQPAR